MQWLTTSHKRLFVFSLITVFVVFILFPELQKRPIYILTRPVVAVFSTIQNGFMSTAQGIGGIWKNYISLTELHQENVQLSKDLDRIKKENIALLEATAELERIREILELKKSSPYPMIAARVIGRDPTNWYQSIVTDKGEKDGVTTDMGVISPAGVVGRIVKTYPHSSRVLLLTDRNSSVAGLIQRTRDEGIIGGAEKGLARIKYIPVLSKLEKGDLILTSGLVGSFPKGLLIGWLGEVEVQEMALFRQAELIPAVDFSKLEEVMIIGDSEQAPTQAQQVLK